MTPTLSVDAVQLRLTWALDTAVAVSVRRRRRRLGINRTSGGAERHHLMNPGAAGEAGGAAVAPDC